MAYKIPKGYTRIFTYLPDALHQQLALIAVAHRRPLVGEFQVALEEYLFTHQAEIPQLPVQPKEAPCPIPS